MISNLFSMIRLVEKFSNNEKYVETYLLRTFVRSEKRKGLRIKYMYNYCSLRSLRSRVEVQANNIHMMINCAYIFRPKLLNFKANLIIYCPCFLIFFSDDERCLG